MGTGAAASRASSPAGVSAGRPVDTGLYVSASGVLLGSLALGVPLALIPSAFDPTQVKAALFAMLLTALLAVHCWAALHGRRRWLGTFASARPMAAVFAAALLSASLSTYRWASVGELLRLAGCFALAILAAEYVRCAGTPRPLLAWLLVGTVGVCAYAALQKAGLDPFHWDVGAEAGRVLGTLGNAAYLAGYLVLLIPTAAAVAITHRRRHAALSLQPDAAPAPGMGSTCYLASGLVLVMLVCLVWTYTRGAWLGILFGAAVFAALSWRSGVPRAAGRNRGLWAVLVAVVVLAVCMGAVLSASPKQRARVMRVFSTAEKANSARVLIWRGAVAMFRDHPVLGVGPGTFWIWFPSYQSPRFHETKTLAERTMIVTHAHNEPLQVLAEGGLLAAVCWCWLLGSLLLSGVAVARRAQSAEVRLLSASILAGVSALGVQSLTNPVLSVPAVSVIFWMLVGVLIGMHRMAVPLPDARRPHATSRPLRVLRILIGAGIILGIGATCYLSVRLVVAGLELGRAELALRAGDIEPARRWLESSRARNPYDVRVLYRLGHVHASSREYEQALATYRRVQALAPDFARVHYNLGVVLLQLGRAEVALAEFQRELRLENSARVRFAIDFASRHMHDAGHNDPFADP